MSADNWARCPRCYAAESDRVAALQDHVAEVYGSVVVEEFDQLRREADAASDALPDFPTTFREDYEVGIHGVGEFFVSYSGECQKCGLEHHFKYEDIFFSMQSSGRADR